MHGYLKDNLGLFRHWRHPGTFIVWMLSAPACFAAAATVSPAPASEPTTLGDIVYQAKVRMGPLLQELARSDRATLCLVGGVILVALLLTLLISVRRRRNRKTAANGDRAGAQTKNRGSDIDLTRRYHALFENANDLIVGTNMEGRVLYVNAAWKETLDYNDAESTALSLFQIIHPEMLDNFMAGFRRAAAGVKTRSLETTLVSKFSKRVIVEGSIHCELVDEEALSMQCIFRDVTERKRSASALKQSEERFSRVFAASPVAIAIATLDEGRLQDVNDSFLLMLRYERPEVIGVSDLDLRLWANTDDRAQIVNKVADRKPVRDAQCKLRTSKGETREALISAELIEINNQSCLVLIIHDNTERLNLEAQLRQAQKMEGIGQLAAGVAHDFNNILTVIQGHAGRLRNADGLPPKIGESVEQVSVAADRAANLTRQLLTFCRKQAMLPKIMEVNETLTHVTKMLERILGEDMALEVSEGKQLPAIHADSGMLELCIINLACNARDAMPKGGKLSISTAVTDITPDYIQKRPKAKLGRHVSITVTDTGIGMKPETLRRVFEPFFTTKDVGKGTGLGLATVYGIVDQHRGWIEVASEFGKGSTFTIFIPEAKQAPKPALEIAAPPPAKNGNETILLVEDELPLRELARVVLEEYKYRVLEAGCGAQALDVWKQHKDEIHMLLTDMVMPGGMTGRDLAEKIQAEKPDIKVLYSSGYSPDVVGGYFKLPENSFFLAKPYHPPKLAQAVRECLDHPLRTPRAEAVAAAA